MVSWGDFSRGAPDLAAEGQRLLSGGAALLATVRGAEPPRIHPISIGVRGDGLYAFILRSPKRTDLRLDGRFALHAHQDPASPSEFSVRGRAQLVEGSRRAAVAADWYFGVDETYELFEFSIESAVLGVRDTADDWPPRYSSWHAG